MHDYEGKTDCFNRIRDVKTILKYGDLNSIPNPWLTVFIPTYKRSNLLREAIESVLNQKHCNFMWDIVIIDNEPDDNLVNETEELVREINNPRILYYRNSDNIRPGDNFNRGFEIARGEWITFLHDDDLLISSSLQRMGELIRIFTNWSGKPLGAISAQYVQFFYDDSEGKTSCDLKEIDKFYSNLPVNYNLYRLNHNNIWFTTNIGGDVPSNGTTFNRKAAIKCGGINEDFGISGDLILFYRLENEYSVYATPIPMGLYRWGNNSMSKIESTIRVIKDGADFREYVYSKNLISKIFGSIIRKTQNYIFVNQVINAKNRDINKEFQVKKNDVDKTEIGLPNTIVYSLYKNLIMPLYFRKKRKESEKIGKKAYEIYCKISKEEN